MRTTRTTAILEVSVPVYAEIRDKLRAAGYDHAFDSDGGIDMHGISIKEEPMATDHDPPNKDEYERLYHANTKIEGFGMEVRQVLACPFCCAPGFMTLWVIKNGGPQAGLAKGATCERCKRGAKGIIKHQGGGVQFEIVQTVGDDPPAYLPPMRRADDVDTKVE